MSASMVILLFFSLEMAALSFEHNLDHLQSLQSLPKDMMISYKALHFGDIYFTAHLEHAMGLPHQPEKLG